MAGAVKMIKLKIIAPLPNLLGFSLESKTLYLELPFFQGANINTIFERLAKDYPRFETILNDKNSNIIGNLLIILDGTALSSTVLREALLKDGCEITFLTPYTGG